MVNYIKTFNLGNYMSEKIGVEVKVEVGEDAKSALDIAKQLVEEYHKESNAGVLETMFPATTPIEQLPVIHTNAGPTKDELREPTLEEQIMSCESVKVLESYKLMVKKDTVLQLAYDKRMYILTH